MPIKAARYSSSKRSFFRVFSSFLLFALLLGAVAMSEGEAEAFCGFYVSGAKGDLYNDATQVVLMRDGERTVLSMSNHYDGPAEDFAMVIPVPVVLKKEHVKTLSHDLLKRVDEMDSPRLVEYWEHDPCAQEFPEEMINTVSFASIDSSSDDTKSAAEVRIEAQFEVGEYDIVILSADNSMALDAWLRAEKYNIPAGAQAVMQPYIDGGMYFFVAKVNLKKVKRDAAGRSVLSPLRFFYDTKTFSLPIRLGLLNAKGPQDLIIHILAKGQRYEAANFPNVTIPTNVEVHDNVKESFGEFYAALFDATQAKTPGAVVTEYSWDASTCDPCPGPTLTGQDFLSLGADELPGKPQYGFVLTRLHARYSAADLKEDIVFKAAPPIIGGREVHTKDGLEKVATTSTYNNFQGRYIIRHYWDGPLECASPQRGIWGGPHGSDNPSTAAAKDVAFAPRGAIKLTDAVAEDIEEIGIKAAKNRKKPAANDSWSPWGK